MDQTATIVTRHTTDILLPISERLLADLAPDALNDLHGLGFWKVTDEAHPLWQALAPGIKSLVGREDRLQGKRLKAVYLVGMCMAPSELAQASFSGLTFPVIAISVRVEVEEGA